MVAVRLQSHARGAWDALTLSLDDRPEVVGIYHVSGEDDLLVHVACRDAEHLRELVLDHISSLPGVRSVQTSLVFSHRTGPLPVHQFCEIDRVWLLPNQEFADTRRQA